MGDVKHHLPVLVAAAAGAAAGAVAAYCYFKASGVAGASQSSKPSSGGTGSTTGSTGGIALYETEKAVNEYLQFHFGADSDILPYENGPKVPASPLTFQQTSLLANSL